jgi:hypothetical protein
MKAEADSRDLREQIANVWSWNARVSWSFAAAAAGALLALAGGILAAH